MCKKIGVKNAGQRVAGLGKLSLRRTFKVVFFSAKKEQDTAFNRTGGRHCVNLSWQVWNVDTHTKHSECAKIGKSKVSFDRLNDPWPWCFGAV